MSLRPRALILTIVAVMLAACSTGGGATTAPARTGATATGATATGATATGATATGAPSAPAASAAEPTPTPRPTVPPRQEGVLTLAHSYADTHPAVRCGAQVIADELAAADVGLTIEIYGGSQLGPDADRILSVQAGDIDIDIQGASALSAIYAPISAVDGAFVFDDSEHMYNYLSGEASQDLKQGFYDATGVTILGGWNTGARQFTANVPIRTPDDLEGLKMRFPGSPTFLLNAEAMGAEAVAVPFEELFIALQQGTVDGQENPLVNIQTNNLTEVQDVVSMSSHQLSSNLVVVGPFWDELSPEQQEALSAAVAKAMVAGAGVRDRRRNGDSRRLAYQQHHRDRRGCRSRSLPRQGGALPALEIHTRADRGPGRHPLAGPVAAPPPQSAGPRGPALCASSHSYASW